MSNYNKHGDRDGSGRPLRKYRRPAYPLSTPKWWRKLHMTRPKRRGNKHVCLRILRGEDPDAMTFPLGNRKPHVYYW